MIHERSKMGLFMIDLEIPVQQFRVWGFGGSRSHGLRFLSVSRRTVSF